MRHLTSGNAGALFGSIFLIIGSTVGAGVLALPAVTQPIGAGPSSVVLVATWALLTVEALLLVDVNLAVRYAPYGWCLRFATVCSAQKISACATACAIKLFCGCTVRRPLQRQHGCALQHACAPAWR